MSQSALGAGVTRVMQMVVIQIAEQHLPEMTTAVETSDHLGMEFETTDCVVNDMLE